MINHFISLRIVPSEGKCIKVGIVVRLLIFILDFYFYPTSWCWMLLVYDHGSKVRAVSLIAAMIVWRPCLAIAARLTCVFTGTSTLSIGSTAGLPRFWVSVFIGTKIRDILLVPESNTINFSDLFGERFFAVVN